MRAIRRPPSISGQIEQSPVRRARFPFLAKQRSIGGWSRDTAESSRLRWPGRDVVGATALSSLARPAGFEPTTPWFVDAILADKQLNRLMFLRTPVRVRAFLAGPLARADACAYRPLPPPGPPPPGPPPPPPVPGPPPPEPPELPSPPLPPLPLPPLPPNLSRALLTASKGLPAELPTAATAMTIAIATREAMSAYSIEVTPRCRLRCGARRCWRARATERRPGDASFMLSSRSGSGRRRIMRLSEAGCDS